MKGKKAPTIDIGISDSDRSRIAKGLSALLADSYTLYLMTHNAATSRSSTRPMTSRPWTC